MRLQINEIFYSIQGECIDAGLPTIFIRLTGCPLRCGYCDTSYAFHKGHWMGFEAIFDKIKSYPTKRICITGGEPLAQAPVIDFMKALIDKGYHLCLETSGALSIKDVPEPVVTILDLKTPGSGEVSRNLFENFSELKSTDHIKCVVCDHDDFKWFLSMIQSHDLHECCTLWCSPSYEECSLKSLAQWVLEAPYPLRLQSQLHKSIWGDLPGK